jgi:hypothetical protein
MTTPSLDQARGRDAFGEEHEEFRNFVCWTPDRVSQVMDTEALQTSSEVFLATHSEIPMYRGDLSGAGGGTALSEYGEEQLLRDFLSPGDYAFVAVLGGAGTGKSHLIRWLSTRILAHRTRRVLLIPRAGTSLHDIVRRVLEGVEGERFDEYRRRLATSDMAISLVEARVRLLDNLAIACGELGSGEAAPTEQDDYLASELPNLLRDPVFRSHFLLPGGVLDQLALHVIGGGGAERVEARRTFTADDLPLAFRDVSRASHLAQQVYSDLVANPGLKRDAVAWLNRHLDEAVAQLMRMSGTDLLRLMIDVRAALATSGIELIILIEDLATLQGIDQQLLEALIIRPRQPDMPELCALRTAVAMTSGYYEGLRTNVRQRFDFRVVMGESDTRGSVAPVAVERFTARYLNAARLAPRDLARWYQDSTDASGHHALQPPSACAPCRFRAPCHAAFGARDGMGLYPFTPTSVANLAARVSPKGFNPRTQLKEAYKPVLENYATSLRDGRFPPPELLQRLGQSRLSALVEAELQQRDPTNRRRRAVLLDVWSDATAVRDLDPVIHAAFSLPRLETGVQPPAPPLPPPPPAPVEETRLDRQLRDLDSWRAGGTMSEGLAASLREVVYAAVVTHIDWNALHLIPGDFAGSGKGFRQANSITFARQFLQPGKAAIRLPIPFRDEDDATDATLALQGLLQFNNHRSWNFHKGGQYYRAYRRQVDAWAAHVSSQINQVREGPDSWDPVPSVVELLAIGARVMGLPATRDTDRPDVVNAVFAALPERDEEHRAEAWQRLTKLVRRYHEKALKVVRSRVACSKGTSRKLRIIDASHILPMVSEVKRTWRPSQPIPDDLVPSLRFIFEYRRGLDELLEAAVNAERSHQLERYDSVARRIGLEPGEVGPEAATARRTEAVDALRRALDAASEIGVLAGVQKGTFEEKLGEFERVQFQAWVDSVARIRDADDPARLMSELSLAPSNAGRVSLELLELADRMLTRTEAALIDDAGGSRGADTGALAEVQGAIGEGLDALISDVASLAKTEVTA